MKRVVCLVDGFNLYHAIDNLNDNRLKWLDLRALAERLVLSKSEALEAVYYFSAYANWLPGPVVRHRAYVKALQARGVHVVMGQFKNKDRRCSRCSHKWTAHEEKETDVNIAVSLLRLAHKNEFDRALLVTRDSDLAPAVRATLEDFPDKSITIVSPPNRGHSTELLTAAHGNKTKIKLAQVRQCQLPDSVIDQGGNLVAERPPAYR